MLGINGTENRVKVTRVWQVLRRRAKVLAILDAYARHFCQQEHLTKRDVRRALQNLGILQTKVSGNAVFRPLDTPALQLHIHEAWLEE